MRYTVSFSCSNSFLKHLPFFSKKNQAILVRLGEPRWYKARFIKTYKKVIRRRGVSTHTSFLMVDNMCIVAFDDGYQRYDKVGGADL
jgi:hypothetical protein